MSSDRQITIVEVGPRDGLQNEPRAVPTDVKIALIQRLAACGLPVVELSSFVSPTAIPQLADADAVVGAVLPALDAANIRAPVLVPNERGYDRAVASGVREIAVFTAASETFNQRNINASIAESIERFEPIMARAAADRVRVRGYVSMAFGCPYEGEITPAQVAAVTARLAALGVDEISLGDTIGVAVPTQIAAVLGAVEPSFAVPRVGLHLHDTRGTALACAFEGLRLGIRTFDTSVAGLGGCPFADGATGNAATEDFVWAFERAGWHTGVDLPKLIDTARWIAGELGREPRSHIAPTPTWP